ncbi:hypothetical protein GQ42DRAFT_92405 [Ramicandelaber brevisporus]|nr:hypothetical protein GQ42DRAFT_92405 [Ramicandelaber brevisporus]
MKVIVALAALAAAVLAAPTPSLLVVEKPVAEVNNLQAQGPNAIVNGILSKSASQEISTGDNNSGTGSTLKKRDDPLIVLKAPVAKVDNPQVQGPNVLANLIGSTGAQKIDTGDNNGLKKRAGSLVEIQKGAQVDGTQVNGGGINLNAGGTTGDQSNTSGDNNGLKKRDGNVAQVDKVAHVDGTQVNLGGLNAAVLGKTGDQTNESGDNNRGKN